MALGLRDCFSGIQKEQLPYAPFAGSPASPNKFAPISKIIRLYWPAQHNTQNHAALFHLMQLLVGEVLQGMQATGKLRYWEEYTLPVATAQSGD